jgi:hypothetical protein
VLQAGGLVLYFFSDRLPSDGYDIWVASRKSDVEPFAFHTNVTELNTEAQEWPTWVSPDGCRLYFSRRPGERGDNYDLYVAERVPK